MKKLALAVALALAVIGGAVAVPALTAAPADWSAYWRYMRQVMALTGAELADEGVAVAECQSFVDTHAGTCEDGRRMFADINDRHPDHVAVAVPALFERSRAALDLLTAGGSA